MAVYTERFGIQRIQTASGGWFPVFTTPADGNAYVLRDICLWNELSTPVLLIAGMHSGSLDLWLAGGASFPGSSTSHLELRQALAPGDVLEMYCQANSTSGVAFTGYKLS